MIFPCTDENVQAVREAYTVLLQEEVIIFRWFSRGLSLEETELVEEEFLHKKVNKNGVYMWTMLCYKKYFRRYM